MVKAQNRSLVFRHIAGAGAVSRLELSRLTRLSLGTVSTIVDELIDAGALREVKDTGAAVGRKPALVALEPGAKKVVCFDCAATTPRCVIKNLALETERELRSEVTADGSLKKKLGRLMESAAVSLERMPPGGECIGVGISLPGPYDHTGGRVMSNMTAAETPFDMIGMVSGRLGLPVYVDHDVKLAALAEIRGAPELEQAPVFYLYLDSGVGGALCVNGRVYGGHRDFAGEIGQMRIDGGPTLEELISFDRVLALLSPSERGLDEAAQGELLARRLSEGDRALVGEIRRVAAALGRALSFAVCLCDPAAVVIDGRYKYFGGAFVGPLRVELDSLLMAEHRAGLDIRLSSYRERSPLVGAAAMVIEEWLKHL